MSGPSRPRLLLLPLLLVIATSSSAAASPVPLPPTTRRSRKGKVVDHEFHGTPSPFNNGFQGPHNSSPNTARQSPVIEEEDNTALIAGLGGGGALLALLLALGVGGGSISSSIECNCNGEFGGDDDDDDDDDDYDVDVDFDYDERGLPISAVAAGAMTSPLPIHPGFAARGPLDECDMEQPQPDGWGWEMGGGLDSAPAHLPFSNDQMEIV